MSEKKTYYFSVSLPEDYRKKLEDLIEKLRLTSLSQALQYAIDEKWGRECVK